MVISSHSQVLNELGAHILFALIQGQSLLVFRPPYWGHTRCMHTRRRKDPLPLRMLRDLRSR